MFQVCSNEATLPLPDPMHFLNLKSLVVSSRISRLCFIELFITMSWSENRSSGKNGGGAGSPAPKTLGGYDEAPVLTEERMRQLIASVDGLLGALARDDDFHDDLATPSVQKAMKHWTGECRLPAEEAQRFEDDFRVMAVLRKIAKLQQACRALRIGVPMDHIAAKRTSLAPELVAVVRSSIVAVPSTSTTASAPSPTSSKPTTTGNSAKPAESPSAAKSSASSKASANKEKSKTVSPSPTAVSAESQVSAPAVSSSSDSDKRALAAPPTTVKESHNVPSKDKTSEPSESSQAVAAKDEPLLRWVEYRNMVLSFVVGFVIAVCGIGARKYLL